MICWWDPLFIAKVLPRPVTPVMTAKFYDRWFLRPLMAHTFQVIRVPEAHVRREAPEIHDAIAALDAGKCVIIFPEGFLRRKEEQPLRLYDLPRGTLAQAQPGGIPASSSLNPNGSYDVDPAFSRDGSRLVAELQRSRPAGP